jgi:formate dehydrogenase subunit delta
MDERNMVHKANQIALFFAAYTHDEAVEGVRNHLVSFWVPRMRAQIIDYVANGGEGLHPVAVDAVKRLEPVTIR